jgi:phosphatidate cytidylyltransferase
MECTAKKNSDFLPRLISAVIVIPLIILLVFQKVIFFKIFCLLCLGLMLREWSRLTFGSNYNILSVVHYIFATLSVLDESRLSYYLFSILLSCLVFVAIVLKQKRKPLGAWLIFGNLYIIIASLSISQITNLHNYRQFFLWVLFLVCSNDIGAYFFGKSLGGPKLARKISPNKTWSGFLGGFLSSLILSLYLIKPMQIVPNIVCNHVFLIVTLIILSSIGDLLESWVKRVFGVKDSGSIIPGHGGLLDRLDSLLLVSIGLSVFIFFGFVK